MEARSVARNPRVDPKAGDIVRKGETARAVSNRRGGNIEYQSGNSGLRICWITTWQAWCQRAEVVHAAAD